MIDTLKGRHEEKAIIRRIKKVSPDQGLIPVRINTKTVIFVKKGQDPQERKEAYLHRVFLQDQRDKKSR